jgi:hypothetical protein
MRKEFDNIKEVIKDLGNLQVADYKKEFLLKTDASNSGMGAVLMQKNDKEELVSV